MLKAYTFPRAFGNKFASLETLISLGTRTVISQITPGKVVDVKPIILRNCANIFLNHFCSKNFDIDDEKFAKMVDDYDEIFYEVNQGYAADFLPFLMPFIKKNLDRMNMLTHRIRDFIEEEVIEDRFENLDPETVPGDYVESLIRYVKSGNGPELTWNTALFALEDIIGGHSAVGNFLVKVFGFLVDLPEVQRRIQEEIDAAIGREQELTVAHKSSMPYTESVIFEAIRLIASPIVPRVANQDSSINGKQFFFFTETYQRYADELFLLPTGYKIEKDTVLFLNNYDLSMSDKLWDRPEKFLPERFLKDGKLVKPDHFLPFGGGRRSCMGYKMVQLVSFGILGGFLQNYTILPAEDESYKVPIGSLAIAKDAFKFRFVRR